MKRSQQGFTLVELAIVLVIIGLIVGGVLVGQDLIKAATLQKGVSSLEETQAAATTFRTKFNAIPGDFTGTTAVNTFTTANGYPLGITGLGGGSGVGDNNGLVESTASANSGTIATTLGSSAETAAFYPELYNAGYTKQRMTYGAIATTITATDYPGAFLQFPVSGANKPLVVVQAANGRNYLNIVGTPTTALAVPTTWTAALSPVDANSIDGKLDDGLPTGGAVIAIGAATGGGSPVPGTASAAGTSATNGCHYTNAYNIGLTTQQCSLSYRASF